jgi:hypothetical protein
MMTRADRYRANADNCEREAREARNDIMKRVCEDVADSWRRLAALLDQADDHGAWHLPRKHRGDDRTSL